MKRVKDAKFQKINKIKLELFSTPGFQYVVTIFDHLSGFRYLQELLPYCPQFYTDHVGRELLAELRSTTTQSLENMETEATASRDAQDPIELKIPHIVAQTW